MTLTLDSVHNAIGSLFAGTQVSMFLLGILAIQVCIYVTRYTKDKMSIKLVVAFVTSLETAHIICATLFVWHYAVQHYGDPRAIVSHGPPSFPITVFLSGFIASVVQCFFAHRMLSLWKSWIVPCICWVLAAVRLAGYVALTRGAWRMKRLSDFRHDYAWLIVGVLIVGAVIDLLIAGTMFTMLYKQKRKAMRLDPILKVLMAFSIETGLVTSLTELVFIITFLTLEDTFVWVGIFLFLPRLFSNTLLANLNARHALRGDLANAQQAPLAAPPRSSFLPPPSRSTISLTLPRPASYVPAPRRGSTPISPFSASGMGRNNLVSAPRPASDTTGLYAEKMADVYGPRASGTGRNKYLSPSRPASDTAGLYSEKMADVYGPRFP